MTSIKPLFSEGPSLTARLMAAVIMSVTLIAIEQRNDNLNPLRSALSVIVYPIQLVASLPVELRYSVVDSVRSYNQLRDENERLKEQLLESKSRLLKFSALEKENIRLHALLESSFKLGDQFLVAELVTVNLAPYEHIVLVNKGTRFGVHAKQPVLDAYGVVGQVVRANPLNAEVMLITDPSHAIPVQINRNGLRTIAFGSGQVNVLNLPFLPNNADIEPGDLLVSSGLGGSFPQGYPVGTVDQVSPQPSQPFAKVTATPAARLDRSRELLLVWSDSNPIPLTDFDAAASEPNEHVIQQTPKQ